MRLDHIAYRVVDKAKAQKFFETCFGYKVADCFDLKFDDGSTTECIAMVSPEQPKHQVPRSLGDHEVYSEDMDGDEEGWKEYVDYHLAPEIFVSEGQPGSIVDEWVKRTGGGVHHFAYEVKNVQWMMGNWEGRGIEFASEPLVCEDGSLIQVFTKLHPVTNVIYELIQRLGDKGFCRESVKKLMESTDG